MRNRAFRAALVVTVGLSAGFGTAATAIAADPPATTSAVLVNTDGRSLGLAGVLNARDVGGYRTADGHTVRTGLVFRTGDLSKATDADLTTLAGDNVVAVHDLRTGYEQTLAGADRIPATAVEHHDDVIGQAPPQVLMSTLSAGTDLYRAFITTPGADAGFADVLRDIADNPGGVLFHCTGGKDRTGWTSAVLLTILGVDKDTVYYDYLLSNYYRNAKDGDALNGVSAPALDAAFDQVDKSYGTFDNYVHSGLGLTDGDLTALKAKMLD